MCPPSPQKWAHYAASAPGADNPSDATSPSNQACIVTRPPTPSNAATRGVSRDNRSFLDGHLLGVTARRQIWQFVVSSSTVSWLSASPPCSSSTRPPSCQVLLLLYSHLTSVNVRMFTTPPPTGERSIVMSVSACVFVCLFVRDHIFGTFYACYL